MRQRLLFAVSSSLILTLALGIWQTSFAQEDDKKSAVEIIGGDETGFRDFLPFVLSDSYAISHGIKTTVVMGATPEKMIFELPFPEDAEVVASVSHERNKREKYYRPDTVYLQTNLTPAAVIAFYADNLGEDFSTPEESGYTPGLNGGFTPENSALFAMYCYQKDKAMLVITATPDQDITRVSFEMVEFLAEPNACANPQGEFMPGSYAYLPQLKMPEGVELLSWEGGGGSERSQSLASIQSERPVEEIGSEFMFQIGDAGWEISRKEGGLNTTSVVIATMTAEDESVWVLVLTITASPLEENVYDATLMVYGG